MNLRGQSHRRRQIQYPEWEELLQEAFPRENCNTGAPPPDKEPTEQGEQIALSQDTRQDFQLLTFGFDHTPHVIPVERARDMGKERPGYLCSISSSLFHASKGCGAHRLNAF